MVFTKIDFSDCFSSSYAFQLSAYTLNFLLSLSACISISAYTRKNIITLPRNIFRSTKKCQIAAKKNFKHLFKVIDRLIFYLMLIHA